jgi:hypothetical protein
MFSASFNSSSGGLGAFTSNNYGPAASAPSFGFPVTFEAPQLTTRSVSDYHQVANYRRATIRTGDSKSRPVAPPVPMEIMFTTGRALPKTFEKMQTSNGHSYIPLVGLAEMNAYLRSEDGLEVSGLPSHLHPRRAPPKEPSASDILHEYVRLVGQCMSVGHPVYDNMRSDSTHTPVTASVVGKSAAFNAWANDAGGYTLMSGGKTGDILYLLLKKLSIGSYVHTPANNANNAAAVRRTLYAWQLVPWIYDGSVHIRTKLDGGESFIRIGTMRSVTSRPYEQASAAESYIASFNPATGTIHETLRNMGACEIFVRQ